MLGKITYFTSVLLDMIGSPEQEEARGFLRASVEHCGFQLSPKARTAVC